MYSGKENYEFNYRKEMRLSNFTDYSLRVLIYLALKGDKLSTVAEIAESYKISKNHLVKVVHNLSKLGVIESFKGKGGGLRLKIDPKALNIGKLVRDLENDTKLVECFSDEGECQINGACKLKAALKKAQNSFYLTLEEYYLSDVVSNKSGLSDALSL